MQTQKSFDKDKMKAFGKQVRRDTYAMVFGNMAYIGDQLGLFKIMAKSGPVTVEQLAEHSSCHARYIREWLSAMAVAGWIEYDAAASVFTLPPEHAPYLADENYPAFMGGVMESVVPLAYAVPKVMECFRNGGGLHLADHHPDMSRVTDRLNAPTYTYFLTRTWIPDLLPDVHKKLKAGAEVVDVGCGSGTVLVAMARAYPQSRFRGYEPHEISSQRAQARVTQEGLEDRVEIFNAAAGSLPDKSFDFVTTFDVIHDLAEPQVLLQDIHRALKPDGTYLMMELNASSRLDEMMGHPMAKMLYSISTMYCVPASLADGGEGIGNCMGEELPRQMCLDVGFSSFQKLDFDHPMAALYEIRT